MMLNAHHLVLNVFFMLTHTDKMAATLLECRL